MQASVTSILDQKVEASDVVMLDSFVQPVDRGPSLAEAKRLMKTWQYAVTGKVAAAAALSELKVEHIKHGEMHYLCRESSCMAAGIHARMAAIDLLLSFS